MRAFLAAMLIYVFLMAFAVLAVVADAHGIGGGLPPAPVQPVANCPTTFTFGTTFEYNTGYPTWYNGGDGYWPSWGSDGSGNDRQYVVVDDSYGWQYQTPTANWEAGYLDGYTTSLHGFQLNKMTQFGGLGVKVPGAGNQNWKASAIIAVNGVLYVPAQTGDYGNGAGVNPWLPAQQSQIVKSTDHGQTWAPLPPSPAAFFASPMFGSDRIVGGFVMYPTRDYYGQNQHNSDKYVYEFFMTNTNTAPNQVGDGAYLGRVAISKIGNLSASDWSYYQGGDGMQDANWGAFSTAVKVLYEAIPAGQMPYLWWVNAQYLPAFGCYVLIGAYWPNTDTTETKLQVWVSPTPWGTWNRIGTDYDTKPLGLYPMAFIPQSVTTDGGKHTMLTSGANWQNQDAQTGTYNLHLTPLTLQ